MATIDPNNSLGTNANDMDGAVLREESPKAMATTTTTITTLNNQTGSHRDRDSISMQSSDLRAIQRPQAKKLPPKNIGALPPPPQREPSIGSIGVNEPSEPPAPMTVAYSSSTITVTGSAKKEPPPLPPPRPHRHARSSSLDLNKFKIGAAGAQQPEVSELNRSLVHLSVCESVCLWIFVTNNFYQLTCPYSKCIRNTEYMYYSKSLNPFSLTINVYLT